MKISIVTPVYNDPRVARALDSIIAQKCNAEIELVVIDGGSEQPTLEVLERYRQHIDILVSERDRGVYDAMNKGIKLATGDVIGILNADDRYNDDQVLKDVASVMKNPRVDACYGDLVYVDAQDRVIRYWKSGSCCRIRFYFGWMPPHPTFFVRKLVYEQYGDFDLNFPIAADYELMLRFILKHKIYVEYIPRVLVRMSVGGQSNRSLSNIIKANLEVWRAWRKNGLSFGFFVPVLKPARKLVQFFSRPSEEVRP
jgi:glycosyltransferase